MTVDLPRRFKPGRIGISDVPTEPQPDGRPWTTRWTGQNRDIPMPLGTGGGYVYRKDHRGWVFPGPCSRTDQERFLIQGHTFMPQYGEHEDGPDNLGHEYDMLLRLGGQIEMPAEQVISLGWAVKAPEVDGQPVWYTSPLEAFPQLEGKEWSPLRQCKYCSRQLWSDLQENNHVSVMHADRIAAFEQANAIAAGMKEAVMIGRSVAEVVPPVEVPPTPAPVVEPELEPEPPTEPEPKPAPEEPAAMMICGYCGERVAKINAYLAHMKKCKEANA